jgi:peptide/nickel transport system permease protein
VERKGNIVEKGDTMKILRRLLLVFTGLVFISALPNLFFNADFQYVYMSGESGSFGFYPLAYVSAIYDVFLYLARPDQWSIVVMGKEYALADVLVERVAYSMKVFFISLTLAVLAAVLASMLISLAKGTIKRLLLSIVNITESLPDIFIIIGVQLLVVMYFRETGVLIGDIAMTGEEIYLLPVTCLTVVPAVFLVKTIVLLLKEEEKKAYVELARGKGLSSIHILVIHSFRNVLYSLFYQMKLIFSFMLSNLFILEQLFNMRGVMGLLMWSTGYTFVIISTLIFLPFFLLFTIIEQRMKKSIGMKEDGTYA